MLEICVVNVFFKPHVLIHTFTASMRLLPFFEFACVLHIHAIYLVSTLRRHKL